MAQIRAGQRRYEESVALLEDGLLRIQTVADRSLVERKALMERLLTYLREVQKYGGPAEYRRAQMNAERAAQEARKNSTSN